MGNYLVTLLFVFIVAPASEARIRLRKVKEAAKTCALMKEDSLLSRSDKSVWSTERHSVILADDIFLVNDLGQTICTWPRASFSLIGDITNFRFYIDEYKEIIYPYINLNETSGFIVLKTPFKGCSLDEQTKLAKLEFPKCEKPKGRFKKKKRKLSV